MSGQMAGEKESVRQEKIPVSKRDNIGCVDRYCLEIVIVVEERTKLWNRGKK
jgi:hypothetical protein